MLTNIWYEYHRHSLNLEIAVKYEITSDRSSLPFDMPLPHKTNLNPFRSVTTVTTVALNHYFIFNAIQANSQNARNSCNKQINHAKKFKEKCDHL